MVRSNSMVERPRVYLETTVISYLEGLPLLALTEPALLLSERLVAEGAVPPEA